MGEYKMTAYDDLKEEITAYLERPGILKPGLDPVLFAEAIIDEGAIEKGSLHYEISARYTPDGHPNAIELDAQAFEAEITSAPEDGR